MFRKSAVAPALLAVLVVAVVVQLVVSAAGRAEDYESLDTLVEVQHLLLDKYVRPVERDDLTRAALYAMVDSLDDPYTTFIPPEQMEAFNQQLTGVYAGIGAQITTQDGWLTIVTPFEGSPALEAGLLGGTVITEVEGQSTEGLNPQQCAELLLGPPGTSVKIRYLPAGIEMDDVESHLDEAKPASLERKQITTSAVAGLRRLGTEWDYTINVSPGEMRGREADDGASAAGESNDDGDQSAGADIAVAHRLAYVHLLQFSPSSTPELRSLVQRLHEEGHEGLILDLRDNPGGALPAAIDIADLFLTSGVITSVRERDGVETVFRADPQALLPDLPMIVLVNGNAASASEILAGALQDNDRAPVMGGRTYGKGLVQEVAPLPLHHGTLKLTVAHYYLPSGRNINRTPESAVWGVDPSPGLAFLVPDEQYIDWLWARQPLEAITALDAPEDEPPVDLYWLREKRRDPMLARAAETLSRRIEATDWRPLLAEAAGAVDSPTADVFNEEIHRAALRRAELAAEIAEIDDEIERLQGLAESIDLPNPLPESELRGGTIIIRDANGQPVGRYRIDGGDVALALETLRLTPLEPGITPGAESPTAPADAAEPAVPVPSP